MNTIAQQVDALARRLMMVQLVVAVAAALVFVAMGKGAWAGISAFSGGVISLTVVMLLRRGIRRASDVALVDQKRSMMILYFGAVQRFVVILALFALGLGVIGMEPLAVFAGFVAAQAGNFVSARLR